VRVDRISTLAAFDAERACWERLEKLDPEANVFTSWRWLRAYLPVARYRWEIVVLRDGGEPFAYLPLAHGGNVLDRELFLGGNPIADQAGMVVQPARAEAAVAAFAEAVLAMPWDGFNALDVFDTRIDALVQRLVERGARLESKVESHGLWCELPATWDEYLSQRVSKRTRNNALRVERRLAESLPNFRITVAGDDDIDAHIDALIEIHHLRWGGNLRNAHRRFGTLFRNAYRAGLLHVFMYWDGDKAIAGSASFLDELRSAYGAYMLGFNEAYAKFTPGIGVAGRCVQSAIEMKCSIFDFLRGDEDFKRRYVDRERVTHQYRLTRRGVRAAAVGFLRPKLRALKLAAANVVYGPGRSL
jgi:CelD/BcsL family acetyltransferase involved in cellulose biosynthesis